MSFQVSALDAAPFAHLFGQSDAALATRGARAYVVDRSPGFPCRITLEDAPLGERVILVNHEHVPGDTPYRSRHAIFVRDGAVSARPLAGELPGYLTSRLLSVRGFDAESMMTDAEVVDGPELRPLIERLFRVPRTVRLHVHTARQGCYLAAVERA